MADDWDETGDGGDWGGDEGGACSWCGNDPCTCDPDEAAADNAGDFGELGDEDDLAPPPTLQRQCSYEFVDEMTLIERQKKMVVLCSELLGVSVDEAGCILSAYLWNLENAKRDWYDDPEKVRNKVGVQGPPVGSEGNELVQCATFMCEEVQRKDALALGCNHWFCKDCWKGFLQQQVRTKGPSCVYTTCMGTTCKKKCKHRNEDNCSCRQLVPEDFFLKLLDDKDKKMFQKFSRDSFVDKNKVYRWCPAEGCNMVVHVHNDELSKTVYCKCGHSFCFRCSLNAHKPVPCDLAAKFLSLDLSEALIKATTKPCTKCHVLIEKNEACIHMTCRNCRHEFCWLCKKDWKGHGGNYYACAAYNKTVEQGKLSDEQKAIQENMDVLRKHTLFKSRYDDHQKSVKECVQYQARIACQTVVDIEKVTFVEEALTVLARTFRFLQWSYCLSYYCKDGREKRLFVEQQRLMEENAGKMKQKMDALKNYAMELLIEKIMDIRQEIVNYTAVVRKAWNSNLKELEEGQLINVIQNEPSKESEGWVCIKCETKVPDSESDPKQCRKCTACLLHGEKSCWGCKPRS